MPNIDSFCAITAAAELLGQKWILLIVHHLHQAAPGSLRFCELQKLLGGLNPATLSQRLKQLEAAGLVERHAEDGRARHVEYSLTPKGAALEPVIADLDAWGQRWLVQTPNPSPSPRRGKGVRPSNA